MTKYVNAITIGITDYISIVDLSYYLIIQSTLVISNSKGPSKTLRDIRTSTYQIFSTECLIEQL